MDPIRQGDIPGVQLRRRVAIPDRTPQEIWAFLAEEKRFEGWFGSPLAFNPEVGGHLILEYRLADGSEGRERFEVVEWTRPKRAVFTARQERPDWKVGTRLELCLIDRSTELEVDVLQEGFQHLPLSVGLTAWEESRRRWEERLARLAAAAAS